MTPARGLARTVGVVLLAALALVGLGVAVFCLQDGDREVSLTALARYVELPALLDAIGGWLGRLEDSSDVEWWSVLGGASAILVGLVLLGSALRRHRQRAVTVADGPHGRLAVGRSALREAAETAAMDAGATGARARLRRRRLRADLLDVRATHPPAEAAQPTRASVEAGVEDVAAEVEAEPRVEVTAGGRGERAR
ncbi:MAG: hypothetical protein R3C15_17865 [Thermoleophilia bacterium]